MIKKIIVLVLAAMQLNISFGQHKQLFQKRTRSPPADCVKKGPVDPYYSLVNEKMKTYPGLITIHASEDKFYAELSDSVMHADLLIVSRISAGGADMHPGMFGFAGDEFNHTIVRFDKGPGKKIFLRKISFGEYSRDSSQALFMAVSTNNLQPIAFSFDVKAVHPITGSVVIDLTDWIQADNDILWLDAGAKAALKLTAMQPDKSYTESVHSFPENLEIKSVKTYFRPPDQTPWGPAGGGPGTIELNASIIRLPKKQMQSRFADARVGYFTVGYTDFDKNPIGTASVSLIKRWRLEPKPEDVEKYNKGEMVEPAKPIVFYIDPATPAKWVPYLIAGVNDWQKAFEKAGFLRAIVAKPAPTKQQDSTWSLEDARYSAIVYKPSAIANASGPSIADPRTGEILESHINWYHSVMELLQQWYFIQAAPNDARARTMLPDDSLMGQLIRFVSSHEVGHTLGLMHNYGASSTVPVDSLRSSAWVRANGHTPSIMDYARFNYVAQPEDHFAPEELFPRIGAYDEWAIEWGYRRFAAYPDAASEQTHLNRWIISRQEQKALWFGSEMTPRDPRSQSEALGDDAMKAGMYGIRNLKRIIGNLPFWTRRQNEGYEDLSKMYQQLLMQLARYAGHVQSNIGGQYITPKSIEQPGPVYEWVPRMIQRKAMSWLSAEILRTPEWLLQQNILAKTGVKATEVIAKIQAPVIKGLLSPANLNTLVESSALSGVEAYTAAGLINDFHDACWNELKTRKLPDIFRRNLQSAYIEQLTALLDLKPDSGAPGANVVVPVSDVLSLVRGELERLQHNLKTVIPVTAGGLHKMHYQQCVAVITASLNTKKAL